MQRHPDYTPPVAFDNLLYADDTLLIHASPQILQDFMSHVGDMGRQYGLSLNWSKVEVMPIRCECRLEAPDGTPIKQVLTEDEISG